MQITPITQDDFALFWPTFKAIAQARETYAFDPDIGFDDAYALWCELPQFTYVAKEDGVVLGSYYLKPNAAGPGDHICNCGYMVAPRRVAMAWRALSACTLRTRPSRRAIWRCSSMPWCPPTRPPSGSGNRWLQHHRHAAQRLPPRPPWTCRHPYHA